MSALARAPLRVTVLRCDDNPEPERLRHGDPGTRTARHVAAAAALAGLAVEVDVADVRRGGPPPLDDDAAAYVTTGSANDPDSAEPWIVALRGWLGARLRRGGRVYGVCFGHQLGAHALGAPVGRAPAGWEVGLVGSERLLRLPPGRAGEPPAAWTGEAAVAPGAAPPVRLIMSHRDEVHALPAGAALWLRGAHSAVQGFVASGLPGGGALVGVQGHPEFEVAQVRDLYARRREVLGEARWRCAHESVAEPSDGLALSAEVLSFLLGDRVGGGGLR